MSSEKSLENTTAQAVSLPFTAYLLPEKSSLIISAPGADLLPCLVGVTAMI